MNALSPWPKQPSVQDVAKWLLKNNLPPLPIAPEQDAYRYPKVNLDRPNRGIYCHTPLVEVDGKLCPISRFTGKNPSYLDADGHPHSVNHRDFQSRMPNPSELDAWFSNPQNGIATLGNERTVFIDFDVKNFGSQDVCDAAVLAWAETHPQLKQTYAEQTHRGGWHFMVQLDHPKDFTNFALEPGGQHVGEVLGVGRVCVLAPTIGPTGNPYRARHLVAAPVAVADLSAIGIFKSGVQTATKNSEHGIPIGETIPIKARPRRKKTLPGSSTVDLSDLISDRARDVLAGGGGGHSDRSYAIVSLARETFGWENWARENGIPLSGQTAEALTIQGGLAHGADEDHIHRIMDGASLELACPSCEYQGAEFPWVRLRKVSPTMFEQKAPLAMGLPVDRSRLDVKPNQIVNEPVDLNHDLLCAASRVLHERGQVGSNDLMLAFVGDQYAVNLDKEGKLSILKDGRTIFVYENKKTVFNRSQASDSKSLLADAEIEPGSQSNAEKQATDRQYPSKSVELLNLAALILSRAGQPSELGGFKVEGRRNSVILTEEGVLLATQEGRTVLKAKGSAIEFSRASEPVLEDFRNAVSILNQQNQGQTKSPQNQI
ncbi:bifunctional DNA primase/polymerase [Nodosilinea sp. LEGE 07298]|uniref:bifunctional DNA primase/polymerase n=1 Tax=Nodosilinea sp. LEGE 07298 TaxID=2777970 RepID=UPI001883091E|nr:bifunctional DNA primase/polymerase [Nodosilinea sp. LEGE 07298]MBE9108166.1 bifunctional DNA primase/polymerase [Nodosilinea sp. LEGE 07298]